MSTFSTSIEIKATPDTVWKIMKDVDRWHEWTPSVRSVRRLTRGPFGIGTVAIVRQPGLPPAVWKVTELKEPAGFAWVSGMPGLKVVGGHWIVSTDSGSRVTLSVEYTGVLGPIMARLLRSITDSYIGMEAEGLKKESEGAEMGIHDNAATP